MKTCFVVCPIGNDGSEIRKRSDQLLKHIIEPVCLNNNFECIRVDKLNSSDCLTETILNYLKTADLVIADLTDHNPNAFYEMGYRSALNKPIIHLKSKEIILPFDVSSIRAFDYDLKDLDAVDSIKDRLSKTIQSTKFDSLEETDSNVSNINTNAQILEELFKIQDGLSELNKKISNSTSDTTTISLLADKLIDASKKTKSQEEILLEFLSNLIENPDQVSKFIDISKKLHT